MRKAKRDAQGKNASTKLSASHHLFGRKNLFLDDPPVVNGKNSDFGERPSRIACRVGDQHDEKQRELIVGNEWPVDI